MRLLPPIVLAGHSIESDNSSSSAREQGIAISEHKFISVMEHLLILGYSFVPLNHFLRIKPNTVLLTFDDAFRNLFRITPFLKENKIPAVIFAVFGRRDVDPLPNALMLMRDRACTLDGAHELSMLPLVCRLVNSEQAAEIRQFFRQSFHSILNKAEAGWSLEERDSVCEMLTSFEGFNRQTMNREELRALLHDGKLFEIGAHSITHRRLATLSDDEAAHEVLQSIRDAASFTDGAQANTAFAYPFGSHNLKLARIVRRVGAAGFIMGNRPVSRLDHRGALPRFNLDHESVTLAKIRNGSLAAIIHNAKLYSRSFKRTTLAMRIKSVMGAGER